MLKFITIQILIISAVFCIASTNGPALPTEYFEDFAPPSVPTEVPPLPLKKGQMWELSFEWRPTLDSTNVTTYPIVVRVPFKHKCGFVRVVATCVDVEN